MAYTEAEIDRIVRYAFDLARTRRRRLTSVDKANVLNCSRLWRAVADSIAPDYPDVELQHLLVDNCAMNLVRRPREFDVLVMENMFGDILTDEASMLVGSMGMLPSASLGARRTSHGQFGLYEPVHGSAPRMVGQQRANPLAAILSAALLLRHSLSLPDAAEAVEHAVEAVVASGLRTPDIAKPGARALTTREMGEAVERAVLDPGAAGASRTARGHARVAGQTTK